MSRAKLRKELQSFTQEQLVEVVLAAYDSSAKAKEYFEFFLNPDVDRLLEKYVDTIAKEINKKKWGMCKARISVIRNCIKEYEDFGADVEHQARLVYYTFRMLLGTSMYYDMSVPLRKGIGGLAAQYMAVASAGGFLENALKNIRSTLSQFARPDMRSEIEQRLVEEARKMNISNLII